MAGDDPALLDAAREAFTSGVSLVGWVSAAVTATIAVVVLVLVRDRPAGAEQAETEEQATSV